MKEIINYYEILGVKENATYAEIKSARNKLIKQYHPDKDQSKKAYEKTEQINSAYKVLSSVDLRKKHDDMLRELRKEKQEFEEINNIKEQSVKEKKPNIFVRIFNYFKNLRKNRIKLKEEKKLSKQEQKENKKIDKQNDKSLNKQVKNKIKDLDEDNSKSSLFLLLFIFLIIAAIILLLFFV